MQFGGVTPFLEKHEIAPTTQAKLLELLHDTRKKAFLQMELASVVYRCRRDFCEINLYSFSLVV